MKTISTISGKQILRVSRWIKIRQAYNVSEKHSLYYYATDENGNRNSELKRRENNLDYFVFNGRKYAIEQFINFGFNGYDYKETDKSGYHFSGEFHHIGYYDVDGDLYNPYMIECDDCGEYIRVYREL